MTDLETAIMIKNMARGMVRAMTATAKNADEKRPYLEAIKGKIRAEGYDVSRVTESELKKIFAGTVSPTAMTALALKYKREGVLNTSVKNADMTVKRDFTWSRSFASGPASLREVKIKAGAPVEKRNGDYFVKPSYFSGDSILKSDATTYGCRVAKDNIDGI